MKRKLETNSRIISKLFTQYPDTFIAFCELINNSIQAKAKNIHIRLTLVPSDELPQNIIRQIEIEDDGYGVSESDFDKKILQIATDVKEEGKGIGRFGALQIGHKMEIETVAYDQEKQKHTKIYFPLGELNTENLTNIELESQDEILEIECPSYYKVTISDLYEPHITKKDKKKRLDKRFLPENIKFALFEHYPTLIFNKDINIFINDDLINPNDYIIGEPEKISYEYSDLSGDKHEILFEYINIKLEETSKDTKIKIFLRVNNAGISNVAGTFKYHIYSISPKLGSWFVYVDSELFTPDIFRNFEIQEMDPDIEAIKEFIQSKLDDFFIKKDENYQYFSNTLEKDIYYPYKELDVTPFAKKMTFNQVAYLLEEKYKLIKKQEKLRQVIYPLIDKSLSHGSLENILKNILNLDESLLDQFKTLLNKTDMENIIIFADEVTEKIKFLDFLHQLIYGEISNNLKERSQLHKIIQKNLWIFGESYKDSPSLSIYSDKNLENNLINLRKKFFEYELSKEDDNLIELQDDKVKNITDLFFFHERILDTDNREIMIVELKAPRVRIHGKELNQIDKYAYDIREKAIFSKNFKYKLILISSEISKYAKTQIGQIDPKKPFLYKKDKDNPIESWVIQWSDLIEENRRKLSYLSTIIKTKDINLKEIFEKEYAYIDTSNINSILSRTSYNKD